MIITENGLFKTVIRPEGIYQYNKNKKEYTFLTKDKKTGHLTKKQKISEYKFRKAIREEREEWKEYTED